MKKNLLLIFMLIIGCLAAQIPQNYESNLSLYGHPKAIKEYYYHRLAQLRGHFYTHQLTYSATGKILEHWKSNEGLYDTILPLFENALPPVGTTIYTFNYDTSDRLVYFKNIFKDSASQTITQRDEAWVYDDHDMLIQRNFWEWSDGIKVIKNPSYQRAIIRDAQDRIVRIEKKTYSFLDRGLALSEITQYKYNNQVIDSIIIYQKNDLDSLVLLEKRYNLIFASYSDTNTDSLLLFSYTSLENNGATYINLLQYDTANRQTLFEKKEASGNSVLKKEWIFEPYMTAMIFNESQRFETHYDASGNMTYQENFTKYDNDWLSDEVPLEVIERNITDEKVTFATIKLWDQDQPFYRQKADFEYIYDITTLARETLFQNVVYPNPCQGFIHLNNKDHIASLFLITTDGKNMLLPLNDTVPLQVAKGMYFLQLRLKDGSTQAIKLVVE